MDFLGEFHIETSEDCDYDYLQVVDGPFSYSPVIGRFCGRRQPPLIESTGRYLWLRFHSDDSIEYVGFHVVYEFIPAVVDHQHDDPGIPETVISRFCKINGSFSLFTKNFGVMSFGVLLSKAKN